MKSNRNTQSRKQAKPITRPTSCRGLGEGLYRVRNAMEQNFRDASQPERHWVRLALNEAEALAWQTAFPHLVFPALAEEKLQAFTAWQARQRALRRGVPSLPLAA
jgi:hypothetical protein